MNSNLRLRVALAFASFILIGANDGALGVLLPSIGGFYNVDKATVSLLFLFGSGGYMLSAFTSGLVVHRLGLRRALGLSMGLFLVGAALLALRLSFPVTLLGQGVLAFGIGTIDAGFNSYIAGLPQNTAKLNYLHAFYGAGALVGPIVASAFLAISLLWSSVYALWALLSLLLGGSILLIFRHNEKSGDERQTAQASGGNVMAGALRLRIVWLAAIFLLFYVGSEVTLGNWSYSLLTESRGQAPLFAGWTVSGYWLGLTLGRLFLGRLSNRIGDRRLVQVCLAGVVVGLLLIWLPPLEITTVLGLGLTGFSLGPIYPTTIAVISRIIPQRLLPSSIGFAAGTSAIGGAFLPWLAGNMAQGLGLWTLLPYVIVLSAVMLLVWWVLQAQPGQEELGVRG